MNKICYIISAGDCSGINFIKEKNDYVIAADGGYQYALDMKIDIDMVIGDFDSLGYVPQVDNVVSFEPEKDDTDTLLAIKEGEKLGYREFVLYGALGGRRLDHSISNIQSLLYLSKKGLKGTIIDEQTTITAVSDGNIVLPKREKGYFSVFSFSTKAVGVTITNAKYCVDDAELSNDFPVGVSNEFVGEHPVISVKKGDLIIMWQR